MLFVSNFTEYGVCTHCHGERQKEKLEFLSSGMCEGCLQTLCNKDRAIRYIKNRGLSVACALYGAGLLKDLTGYDLTDEDFPKDVVKRAQWVLSVIREHELQAFVLDNNTEDFAEWVSENTAE